MMYYIQEIKDIINADSVEFNEEEQQRVISRIVFDSRSIFDSGDVLFVCLDGKRRKGVDYLIDAYEKGVRSFLVSKKDKELDFSPLTDVIILYVENVLKALQKLSKYHREQHRNLKVVGITGSYGKTILKEWLFQLLHEEESVVRSPNSFNSQLGVPLSILEIESHHSLGIFEAGISEPDTMQNLEQIIQPSIGIITNIGEEHNSGFQNMMEKALEKSHLLENCEMNIFSADDENVFSVMKRMMSKQSIIGNMKFIYWSKSNEEATLYIESQNKDEKSTTIDAKYKSGKRVKNVSICFPFSDNHSIDLCIHAWCVMLALNKKESDIKEKFLTLTPFHAKMEITKGVKKSLLYSDVCEITVKNISRATEYITQNNKEEQKALILMSDFLNEEKFNILLETSETLRIKNISRVHLCFENSGKVADNFSKYFNGIISYHQTEKDLLDMLHSEEIESRVFLILSNKETPLRTIVASLEENTHETYLKINLSALAENVKKVQNLLAPDVKTMCMVKAMSYGAGYQIAKKLQNINIDYLAVAYVEEGVLLRQQGITIPIMVMCPEERAFDKIIEYHLEPEIYSVSILKAFAEKLEMTDKNFHPIHLKIETGMHRLGIESKDLKKVLNIIHRNNLKVKTVFTHLSYGNKENEDKTIKQINLFKRITEKIKSALPYPFLCHALSTRNIQRFPQYHFDMVRLGIGMYGMELPPQLEMQNVLTLRTTISQIKVVAEGGFIGYDFKDSLNKTKKIAIIRIGYADGFRRSFGNGKVTVYLKDKKVKVIGNVCMDMAMIDITEMGQVKEGEEVIIFKTPKDIEYLASKIGTISYEILTGISHRVKRVYTEDK